MFEPVVGIRSIMSKRQKLWVYGKKHPIVCRGKFGSYLPRYPVFIDAAIQSLGLGFVGTDKSTMSLVARRRVESWSDGATRIIKWGKANSDNH